MTPLPSLESGAKSPSGASFPQGIPMPRTDFIATGFHVPERVVTNDDLSRIMDTSDEWITQRSGIKTRHWVSDGETGVTLARQAALQALAKAGMKATDLDCIASTGRPAGGIPPCCSVTARGSRSSAPPTTPGAAYSR